MLVLLKIGGGGASMVYSDGAEKVAILNTLGIRFVWKTENENN